MSAEKSNMTENLRLRAEDLLAQPTEKFLPADIADINKLHHELAVHQAELELQNEELQNTQLSLRKVRDRYVELYENAPVGYVLLDDSGIIRRTNSTWRAMLGRPEDDFCGTPFAETLTEGDSRVFLSRFRSFFHNPAEKQIELRIKRHQSEPFHAHITAKRSYDEQEENDSDELMVIVSDITERKRAEEKLREQRDFSDNLIETAQSIILVLDTQGRIVQFNSYMEQLGGYKLNEVKGQDWFETFIRSDNGNPVKSVFQDTVNDVHTSGTVNPIIAKNGRTILVEWSNKTLKDKDGRTVGVLAIGQDITEKKNAEEALNNTLKRFEDVVTNTSDWIWEINLEGKYTYNSGRIESVLGYKPEDVIGVTVVSLMTKESAKAAKTVFRKLLQNQTPFTDLESWFYHKDGRLVCLSSGGVPVFDSDGKLAGYRGADKDITDKKHEEVLLSSRIELTKQLDQYDLDNVLRKILDKAEAITDSQISFFHYVEDDQEYLRLQAWSERTLENFCKVGKGFDHHYPISRAGVWTDCIREKKTVIHNDYESLLHKNGLPEGHAHVVRELVVPIIRGDKVKAIFGVGNKPHEYNEWDIKALERFSDFCWEILERKRVENDVRRTNDILLETQKIGSIGTWELDFTENKISWSPENCRIFGVPAYTAPTFELFVERIHPDDREKVMQHFEKAKKTGVFDIEYRLVIDHQTKWVHGKGGFEYKNDEPVRVLGFTQDITEKKNYQQAQLRSGQLSALGEVAAGVAHEINNPINGVINYAQLLINRNSENEQSNQILERIIREGNRIATIVKNLLNFATKDRNAFSSLDIADIVTEPLNLKAQLLKEDGINIELRVPSELPKIYGNRMQLEQVVLNLLSNARHALNKKYPDLCNEKFIFIEAVSSNDNNGGCVQLSIKDFGCGIANEHLDKIFNPFFTTKEAGVGTGLGLSVSHEILEKHNATISVESEIDKFTNITMTFRVDSQ